MAPTTPTTKEINDNIIALLEAKLNQTIPLLPKAFLRVLAKTFAAIYIQLWKYAGWIFFQIFIQSASDLDTEINGRILNPLTEWGLLIIGRKPVAAVQAELIIDITVENQVGNLDSGSQLVGDTNGVTYITLTTIPLDAPTKSVTVKAVDDQAGGNGAGVIGNLDDGAIMSFANPLGNVATAAVVTSTSVTGVDGETTVAYKQAILDRFQKTPQGGALADYVIWGKEAAGIVNIFPYTSDCPGQVDVFAEADTTIDPDGIPTTAQLEDVLAKIEFDLAGLATRRPAGAQVNTFAITRTPFDITVSGITNVDNLAQVESDIVTAVTEYFLERGPFIIGLNVPPRRDIISRSSVSGVVDDIVSAAGGVFIGVVVKQGAFIIDQFPLGIGEKSKALSVVFI